MRLLTLLLLSLAVGAASLVTANTAGLPKTGPVVLAYPPSETRAELTAVAVQPEARFEPSACPFEDFEPPPDIQITCGTLSVPEQRARAGGRSIQLAVAILKSRSPNPAPDPVVFLEGGPGYGSVENIEAWSRSSLLDSRDLILFDQRGTGYSKPALHCTEFDAIWETFAGRVMDLEAGLAFAAQATDACRARLEEQGVDLTAYNSAASAADLNDLRIALGIQEWNLFGVSYGTRLALTTMRDYPQGIHSVVLDSVFPPQVDAYAEDTLRTLDAYRRFFAGCAADPACRAAFPDLEAHFNAAVEKYNQQPVRVELANPAGGEPLVLLADGDLVATGLFGGLNETRLIPYLPLAIEQIYSGNVAILGILASELFRGYSGVSHGMWYSVDCHEEAPFDDRQTIQEWAKAEPALQKLSTAQVGFLSPPTLHELCARWNAGAAGPIEGQPVRSDIPTLVLAGEYDSSTPPAWSRLAASGFSNHYYFEFSDHGHGVTYVSDCARSIRNAFLDDPTAPPEAGCLETMASEPFVTEVYANPGIYRLAAGLLGGPDLLQAGLLAASALLFLPALAGWPLAALAEQRRSRPDPSPRLARAARWLGILAAAVNLAFLAGLAWFLWQAVSENENILLLGLPAEAAPLFALPWLAAILAASLAVLAFPAWRGRYWSAVGRAHFLLLTLSALGLAAWYIRLGFVGW
jgi:pimeloyl-ACP methyl ester carboxylesterase